MGDERLTTADLEGQGAPDMMLDDQKRRAAIESLPWYLQGAVELFEPEAVKSAADYREKVERSKMDLRARPGEQGTGMMHPNSGAEINIPDTWDAAEFRSFVMMYKRGGVTGPTDFSGGATGASGGPMSLDEALRAAAADFREIYGDERNWANTGTVMTDQGDMPVNYPINERRKARAAERARLTGRRQSFLGTGKLGYRQLGWILPDKKAMAVRKAADAVDRMMANPKDAGARKTARGRLAGLETRAIYNTPDMSDEEVKANEAVHGKIDRIRERVGRGALTVAEGRKLMAPLIAQLAEGRAVRDLKKLKEEKTADQQAQWQAIRQRRAKGRELAVTQAKEVFTEAAGDVKETQAEIKAVKAELADARTMVDPDRPKSEAAARVAELAEKLAGLDRQLTDRRTAASEARKKVQGAREQVAAMYADPIEDVTPPRPRHAAGGTAVTRWGHGERMGNIMAGDEPAAAGYEVPGVPAGPIAEYGTQTLADGGGLDAGDTVRGMVPGTRPGEVGYDGGDGDGDPLAMVEEVTAESVKIAARDASGKEVTHEVPLNDVDEYYAMPWATRPQADTLDPRTGALFQLQGTGRVASVSGVSETAVKLSWMDEGKRVDRVMTHDELRRLWGSMDEPGRPAAAPTSRQLAARERMGEIKKRVWANRKLTAADDEIFGQLHESDRQALLRWIYQLEWSKGLGMEEPGKG